MMSAEEDTGVIIYINEGKDMKIKPLYKSVNLRYLLFQPPAKRRKITLKERENNPYEDSK
jgi:hypothetical protein